MSNDLRVLLYLSRRRVLLSDVLLRNDLLWRQFRIDLRKIFLNVFARKFNCRMMIIVLTLLLSR